MHFSCIQLEQEIECVLGKQGLQRSFTAEWTQKWVPAIINYSKVLKRKDIKETLKEMERGIYLIPGVNSI